MIRAASLAGLAASLSLVNAGSSNSTTTTTANNGTNPLIPTSISASCQNTLANINGDVALAACTQPLLDLLKVIDPATAGGAVPSNVVTLLNQTCAAAQGQAACDDAHVRTLLRSFAGNCSAELAANNPVVVANYDVLYTMTPFRQAACSVDSKTGSYCIAELAAGTAPSSGGSISSSSSGPAANATGTTAGGGGGSVVSNATNHAAAAAFDITDYAGAALTPANLVVQFTNQNAATILGKRGSVALPSGAPTCATNCWSAKLGEATQYGLDTSSASSLCGNSNWINSYKTCASQNCGSSDASAASSAVSSVCSAASSSSSSSSTNTTSSSSSSSNSTSSTTSSPATAPNAKTFSLSNLPYLFLSGNMSSSFLCTQCTQTIMLRYLQWESTIPYVSGLASSPLLGAQAVLWSGIGAHCGSGFTATIEAGTSAGDVSAASASMGALTGFAAVAAAALVSSYALL